MSDTSAPTPAATPFDASVPSTSTVPATPDPLATPDTSDTRAAPDAPNPPDAAGAPVDGVAFPDRLAVDPSSPHHVAAVFEHPVGIRFNGRERHDVEEYCVSEGWIKVASGKTKDRRGRPLLMTLRGRVEPFRP